MSEKKLETEVDIFDVPAENLVGGGGSSEAYRASVGIHQATCVAVLDMGEQENKFQPGKKQRKGQMLFALNDQTVVFAEEGKEPTDTKEPVTVASRWYTISFNEKASLVKDVGSMGVKIDPKATTFGSLVGAKCMLIINEGEEGQLKVTLAPPAKNQADPEKPVYLPKFWLSDSEGNPTGYKVKTHPTLVIPGVRPKHEEAKA